MFHIVVEGPTACGKTTLINELKRRFSEEGYSVTLHKEPTKSPWGRILTRHYKIVDQPLSQEDEFSLSTQDREHSQHIVDKLLKIPRVGFLLQDRNYLSAVAYQGADPIHEFRRWRTPHLTILLTASVPVLKQRMKNRVVGAGMETQVDMQRIVNRYNTAAHTLREEGLPIIQFDTTEGFYDEQIIQEIRHWAYPFFSSVQSR